MSPRKCTLGGSGDVSYGYFLRPGPRSSTHVSTKSSSVETSSGPRPSTHVPTKSSPVETSPPKGYEDAPIYQFTGIQYLRKRVQLLADKLVAGRTTEQHLVFRGVTKDQLTQIDHRRASIGKGIRMTHFTDTDLLIVKVPTIEHETAHMTLSDKVNHKLEGMGLAILSLWPCGSTTYHGSGSSKEGDSTYKPRCRTRRDDWPVLVIEAGVSETLTKLRADADWWLIKSGGEVKIAIVISIVRAAKSLRIEKWCLSQARPGPVTRANPRVSTKIQELTIIQNPPQGTIPTHTVTGAPLILEFEKLLLRMPVPPEGNVIITAAELQAWAADFWSMIQ